MIELEYLNLGVALLSSLCVMNDFYIIECCNLVALKCTIDLYYKDRKDLILHHIMVLGMAHYNMNQQASNEYINELASVNLATEISTVFLSLNILFKNSVFKNFNKMAFVSTFFYYRLYKYSYLLNKKIHNSFYIHSSNNFEYCEICLAIYGMFILNLYWGTLIFKKCINSHKRLSNIL